MAIRSVEVGWAAAAIGLGLLAAQTLASANENAALLAPTSDFSQAEARETLSGGSSTGRRAFGRDAFSQPSDSLSLDARARFFRGNGVFRQVWVAAPADAREADGLGPLFNARSCQRCHLRDGRGHPPSGPEDDAVSMVLRLSVPPRTPEQERQLSSHRISVVPEPTYGRQLQDQAVRGHRPEGRVTIEYEELAVELAGGEVVRLRKPLYGAAGLGYGPMQPDVTISPRVAPPLIGLGLLEAIAEADILAGADPDDRDGDGISGRANRVWSAARDRVMLGRFGWKAGQPSLADQSAAALAGDLGIGNPLAPAPWGDCTPAQDRCRAALHGDGPESGDPESGDPESGALEASAEVLDLVLFYVRTLAVPARRGADDPTVLRGKERFYAIGCVACHRPKFATAADHRVEALAAQLIWPYSDLLLHDMGAGLADDGPEGMANGREWRTQPLWGIGLTETVNGHTFFLHDGRARNLTEAILWHGGEAEAARNAFAALPQEERDALLAFLNSL